MVSMTRRRVLVTGAAGFIGYHVSKHLHYQGDSVFGIDNFNDYYDPLLKRKRAELLKLLNISIVDGDIQHTGVIQNLLKNEQITHVIHLAAQAGVRYSITHPEAYLRTNIDGFLQVLEAIRKYPEIPLVYASSSSVYGLNKKVPFSIDDTTDSQANFYGVTKKTNELMAATYHYLYNLSVVGLRFFTVYGPWGRPDMAYYKFAKAIQAGVSIDVYNQGNMRRDFTYIDDIVAGVVASLDVPRGNYLFNIGNEKPESLLYLINCLETYLGKKAILNLLPMPLGEIEETWADITTSKQQLRYLPKTSLVDGMNNFLDWFCTYNQN